MLKAIERWLRVIEALEEPFTRLVDCMYIRYYIELFLVRINVCFRRDQYGCRRTLPKRYSAA